MESGAIQRLFLAELQGSYSSAERSTISVGILYNLSNDLCHKTTFSVQDPKPVAVHPAKGPAAGGTRITITGDDLDTATKDDIAVTVGGFPCEV